MFSVLSAAIISLQNPIPQDDLNLWVKHSDLIVVAKYIGYQGSYNAPWGRDRENLSEPGFIESFGFEVLLTVHGRHPGPELTVIQPREFDPEEERPSRQIPNVREGNVHLMFLYRPDGQRLIRQHLPDLWFRVSGQDQLYAPWVTQGQNILAIPDIAYQVEGATPVERFVSILSQAFAESKDLNYLTKIGTITPRWRMEDGLPTVVEGIWGGGLHDGPTFFTFFANIIKPRLLQASGEDPVLRTRAYATIVGCADRSVIPDWRALTVHLDQTWPDPEGLFTAAPGDSTWTNFLLNARLPTFRAQGVRRAPKVQDSSLLIRGMLNDESLLVQRAAVEWCQQTFSDEFRADANAPRLPTVHDGRRNFENDVRACVEYWKRKLR